MTWTYSGDPSATSLDAVRFLLGDTVEASAIFSDEELAWVLTQNSNVFFAAALAADNGASKFSAKNNGIKTKTVGALSISYDSERAKEYRSKAASLRLQGALNSTIGVYSGGISKADKAANLADSDWDQPAFKLGIHDHPGTST